ncbi:hypothetical protein PRIC1_007989 [Phytophthora ramorum]
MKKLRSTRGAHASFADALEVIFAPPRGLWRCLDAKAALTLARVCRAARETLRAWLDAVVRDLSLGKETLSVPVQLSTTHLDAQLRAVVKLMMAFVYITSVQLPALAALPPDLLSKQQRDDRCRRVLRGRQVEVVVAHCKSKGWGVLAAQRIERGEYVGEYTGELISSGQMRRRYRERYDREAVNYVLSLREHVALRGDSDLDFDVVRTNVDASSSGSLTRLFNHSCSPCLEVAAVRVDSFVPRLALFARRRIDAGEELTFDYGEGLRETGGGRPCHCRTPECRGYLPSCN